VFVRVQTRLPLQGVGPHRSQIMRVLPTYAIQPLTKTTKLVVVTKMGKGHVLQGSATPLHVAQMRRAVCQR